MPFPNDTNPKAPFYSWKSACPLVGTALTFTANESLPLRDLKLSCWSTSVRCMQWGALHAPAGLKAGLAANVWLWTQGKRSGDREMWWTQEAAESPSTNVDTYFSVFLFSCLILHVAAFLRFLVINLITYNKPFIQHIFKIAWVDFYCSKPKHLIKKFCHVIAAEHLEVDFTQASLKDLWQFLLLV